MSGPDQKSAALAIALLVRLNVSGDADWACSRAECSDTSEGRSPVPRIGGSGGSSSRTRARCFWTRSATLGAEAQAKLLRASRRRRSSALVAGNRLWSCAHSWRRRTTISRRRRWARSTRGLCSFASMSFRCRIPPLRERPDDIPQLVRHFSALTVRGAGRPSPIVEVTDALERWNWPGNIRELANIVERLAILWARAWCARRRKFSPMARRGRLEPETCRYVQLGRTRGDSLRVEGIGRASPGRMVAVRGLVSTGPGSTRRCSGWAPSDPGPEP